MSDDKKACVHCGKMIKSTAKFCAFCGKSTIQEKICRNCGATIEEGIFCPECGMKYEEQLICDSCGTVIEEGMFCPSCGKKYGSLDDINEDCSRETSVNIEVSYVNPGEKREQILNNYVSFMQNLCDMTNNWKPMGYEFFNEQSIKDYHIYLNKVVNNISDDSEIGIMLRRNLNIIEDFVEQVFTHYPNIADDLELTSDIDSRGVIDGKSLSITVEEIFDSFINNELYDINDVSTFLAYKDSVNDMSDVFNVEFILFDFVDYIEVYKKIFEKLKKSDSSIDTLIESHELLKCDFDSINKFLTPLLPKEINAVKFAYDGLSGREERVGFGSFSMDANEFKREVVITPLYNINKRLHYEYYDDSDSIVKVTEASFIDDKNMILKIERIDSSIGGTAKIVLLDDSNNVMGIIEINAGWYLNDDSLEYMVQDDSEVSDEEDLMNLRELLLDEYITFMQYLYDIAKKWKPVGFEFFDEKTIRSYHRFIKKVVENVNGNSEIGIMLRQNISVIEDLVAQILICYPDLALKKSELNNMFPFSPNLKIDGRGVISSCGSEKKTLTAAVDELLDSFINNVYIDNEVYDINDVSTFLIRKYDSQTTSIFDINTTAHLYLHDYIVFYKVLFEKIQQYNNRDIDELINSHELFEFDFDLVNNLLSPSHPNDINSVAFIYDGLVGEEEAVGFGSPGIYARQSVIEVVIVPLYSGRKDLHYEYQMNSSIDSNFNEYPIVDVLEFSYVSDKNMLLRIEKLNRGVAEIRLLDRSNNVLGILNIICYM